MRSDTKFIGVGFLVGGGLTAIVAGAFFAFFSPLKYLPASNSESAVLPEHTAFAPSTATFFTPNATPTFTPTPTYIPLNLPSKFLTPIITPTPLAEISLAEHITNTLPTYGGSWNILIRADGNLPVFSYNAKQRIHVASIIKVPIALLFFKWLEEEGVPPSAYADYLSTNGVGRTYQQLLKAMLVNSEEAAAKTLLDVINASRLDVDAALHSWSAFHTDVNSRYSTLEDVASLFESVYFGKNISPEGRQIILSLLSAYTSNDDTRLGVLRPLLPPKAQFYNKRGTVTAERLIVGDAALLTLPQDGNEKIYVVAILGYHGDIPTTDVKLEHGVEAIARLFWDFASAKIH